MSKIQNDRPAKLKELEKGVRPEDVSPKVRKLKKRYRRQVVKEFTVDELERELDVCLEVIQKNEERIEELEELLDEAYKLVENN